MNLRIVLIGIIANIIIRKVLTNLFALKTYIAEKKLEREQKSVESNYSNSDLMFNEYESFLLQHRMPA